MAHKNERPRVAPIICYNCCGCIIMTTVLFSAKILSIITGDVMPLSGMNQNLTDKPTTWSLMVSHPMMSTELCIVVTFTWQSIGIMFLQRRAIKFSKIMEGVLVTAVGVIFFHSIAVLYGAPLVGSFTETLHFAVLLTNLTIVPCLLILGPNVDAWIRIFALNQAHSAIERTAYLTTICTILGAWFGAFPIPLDWDRPWQVWPISCLISTLSGHAVGLVLASISAVYRSRLEAKFKIV